MNGDKTLFPLFTKGNGPNEPNKAAPIDQCQTEISGLDGTRDDDEKPTKAAKARRARKKQVPGQKTLQEIVNPKVVPNGPEGGAEEGREANGIQPEEPSPRRNKRRRTSRTNSIEVGGQDEEEASHAAPSERRRSPQVIVPASSPLPAEPVPESGRQAQTPPKKMLRLKGGGKFSSPVLNKPKDEEAPMEGAKKRGRPRKVKAEEHEKHLVAVIKYDTETEVGSRIDRILAGEERFKKQVKILPKKQNTSRKANASAHPFFSLDRRKEQAPQPIQPSPRKTSAVTPGKLRRQMNTGHAQPPNEAPEIWTSTLLKDRLMFKHPGAKEPAWPDKEQTHVRGLTYSDTLSAHDSGSTLPCRKRKAARRTLPQTESLLGHFASNLEAEEDGKVRPDGFREAHPSLRLPVRSLVSGQEIAQKIATQLSVSNIDADELSIASSSQPPTHPALGSIYNRISSNLTAFDEGKGETTAWAQKYAPTSCSEVLQPARQTTVLKDWLSSLTVTAVVNATKGDTKVPKKELKPKKRKRRPKDDDMDDFLVDSDEEIHNMDELTDPEDVPTPTAQGRKALNSIVQVAAEGVKLSNAVLLSGPHGCGKTAAAYAAAKELGFKVFEIGSSERRSGKDVLDRVGDMTENHLVKHHGTYNTESGEHSSNEEPSARLDEAFERDLASGRQGKMASFFKPQAKAKPKPKTAAPPKETVKAKAVEAVRNVLKKPPKDQQQSLILLEEVDVLFREDKDFWTTVLKLIATSKRPFIMTCNDEDLVPLQAMSLHAILRFTPPPVDLATDYLLLIAAAEGHLLERSAVSSLYRSKNSDLRASISELDLWCQMGVGDSRGGLSWIFQRYPPGSDLDAKGRRLRIVSEGTYQNGMGSFSERSISVEDQLMWAWREYGIDTSTAFGWESLDAAAAGTKLKDYSKFANDLSAADVYAHPLCSPLLDLTQKPMKDKARSHYVEGLPLLQTDEESDYSGLSTELFTTSTLLAFEARNSLSSNGMQAKLDTLDTDDFDQQPPPTLTRHAFACFDPISIPTESALSTGPSGLQQSAFDGPLDLIAIDIAPYVRSIVHFDLALAEQREALGGGKAAKRARTTRAARSALEGGQRASTRRERWFPKTLDLEAVLGTAGRGWPRMIAVDGGDEAGVSDGQLGRESEGMPASSAESG